MNSAAAGRRASGWRRRGACATRASQTTLRTVRIFAELLRGHGADLVVEILLHPVDARIGVAELMIELLDLSGQATDRFLKVTHLLVELLDLGILVLLLGETRSFLVVALAEETRDADRTRLDFTRIELADDLRRGSGSCERHIGERHRRADRYAQDGGCRQEPQAFFE